MNFINYNFLKIIFNEIKHISYRKLNDKPNKFININVIITSSKQLSLIKSTITINIIITSTRIIITI